MALALIFALPYRRKFMLVAERMTLMTLVFTFYKSFIIYIL